MTNDEIPKGVRQATCRLGFRYLGFVRFSSFVLRHFFLRRIEQVICLLQVIERAVHPAAAPVKIATGFSRQQMIVGAGDKVTNLLGIVQRGLPSLEKLFHFPIIVTGAAQFPKAGSPRRRATNS